MTSVEIAVYSFAGVVMLLAIIDEIRWQMWKRNHPIDWERVIQEAGVLLRERGQKK